VSVFSRVEQGGRIEQHESVQPVIIHAVGDSVVAGTPPAPHREPPPGAKPAKRRILVPVMREIEVDDDEQPA
jgi:hypothetical protein